MDRDKEDRAALKNLHAASNGTGLTKSMRDASNPSGGGRGWRSNPTPITIPSNTNRATMNSRSVASGPFAGRFSDNLRGSGSGNPTAKRTILTHSPTHNPRQEGRPNKRSKLVHDSSVPPDSFYGSSRPDAAASANHLARNPTRNTRRSSNPSTVSAGVIEVLDEEEEEEDIGVTVSRSPRLTRTHSSSSTDPMNIIEDSPIGPSQLARMDQSKSHLIDHPHNGRKAPLRTGRSGPPDGESTKRMQGRILRPPHSTPADAPEIVDDSESDHISDADNWREDEEARRTKTPTRKTTIHTGVVKDRVEKIEKLRRPPPVPHLDLRLEGQKKDQRPSLRGAMKPQSGNPSQKFVQDTLASSSGFVKKPTKKTTQPGIIELPLDAFSLGTEIFSCSFREGHYYYLAWEKGPCKLSIKARGKREGPPQSLPTFKPDRDMDSFKLTPDGYFLVAQMTTTLSCTHRSAGFKAGSPDDDGLVTFKFAATSSDWDSALYKRFLDSLKSNFKSLDILGTAAAKSIWELVETATEADTKTVKKRIVRGKTEKKVDKPSPPVSSSSTSVVPRQSVSRPQPRPAFRRAQSEIEFSDPAALRRSSRHSGPSRAPSPPEQDELLLVYPPIGTGAVNVNRSDLNRLQPGEFLNDTLIEFGLKFWLNELRETNPSLADQVHVFSSFFYKKLNNKNHEEGYQSVRKWTAKFDLFQKKYIIVPINEHLHWYLAIIYEPEHTLLSPPPEVLPPPKVTRSLKRKSDLLEEEYTPPSRPPESIPSASADGSPTPSTAVQDEEKVEEILDIEHSCSIDDKGDPRAGSPTPIEVDCTTTGDGDRTPPDANNPTDATLQSPPLTPLGSDMDVDREASPGLRRHGKPIAPPRFYRSQSAAKLFPGDIGGSDTEAEVDQLASDTEATPPEKEERPRTMIFTLDSFNGRHPQVFKVLKRYLQREAKDKKDRDDTSEAVGRQAMVPMQPNYCDCGIYLLHFVKKFMEDPLSSFNLIMSKRTKTSYSDREVDWDAEAVKSIREDMRAKILELSDEWQKDRAAKEEERRKEGKDVDGSLVVDSSDDEIVLEDMPPKDPPTSETGKGKNKVDDDQGKGNGKSVDRGKGKQTIGDGRALRLR